MHLIWTLLIGLVIGAVAKFLMPGKDPGGIIITMLIAAIVFSWQRAKRVEAPAASSFTDGNAD